MLAQHCKRVVGIDVSSKMIDYAQDMAAQQHVRNLKFICGNVIDVAASFKTNEFDFATITMALHEMPKGFRAGVLAALARIAKRMVVVDFPATMPYNFSGLRNRLFEFLTVFLDWSTEHFFNFLEFREEGGVENIVNICNSTNDQRARAILEIDRKRYIDNGSICLYYISTGTGTSHFRDRSEVDSDDIDETDSPSTRTNSRSSKTQSTSTSRPTLLARL